MGQDGDGTGNLPFPPPCLLANPFRTPFQQTPTHTPTFMGALAHMLLQAARVMTARSAPPVPPSESTDITVTATSERRPETTRAAAHRVGKAGPAKGHMDCICEINAK